MIHVQALTGMASAQRTDRPEATADNPCGKGPVGRWSWAVPYFVSGPHRDETVRGVVQGVKDTSSRHTIVVDENTAMCRFGCAVFLSQSHDRHEISLNEGRC